MKILLTCSNDHPGVKTHLLELRNVLSGRAEFKPIESFVTLRPDYGRLGKGKGSVAKVLRKARALSVAKSMISETGNVIIGSWKSYYGRVVEVLNRWGVQPSILWCSSIGQTEMTWMVEITALNDILQLLEKGKIQYLFVPEKTYESVSHIQGVKYLPHPISLSMTEKARQKVELGGYHVDLFLKVRPGKNVLQQMLAQRYADTQYELHTNIRNRKVLALAKRLKLSFTHHGWLTEKEYYDLVSSMDLSLQVTWTESFNYAVCERFLLGVPVLVSQEIFWVSRDPFLRKHIVVEKIDSPKAIAAKIDALLKDPHLRKEIVLRGREVVESTAATYNKEILRQIAECY